MCRGGIFGLVALRVCHFLGFPVSRGESWVEGSPHQQPTPWLTRVARAEGGDAHPLDRDGQWLVEVRQPLRPPPPLGRCRRKPFTGGRKCCLPPQLDIFDTGIGAYVCRETHFQSQCPAAARQRRIITVLATFLRVYTHRILAGPPNFESRLRRLPRAAMVV